MYVLLKNSNVLKTTDNTDILISHKSHSLIPRKLISTIQAFVKHRIRAKCLYLHIKRENIYNVLSPKQHGQL